MDLMGLMPQGKEHEDREPIIKHECRQKAEEDEVEAFIKGDGWCARLERWSARQRILVKNHYYSQTCLKSKMAIRNEIMRHLREHPRMIHPFSSFRIFWELIMTITGLATLVLVPFVNTFLFQNEVYSLPYMCIISLMLIIDVVLTFLTGIYDKRTKSVDLNPKVVSWDYVKGFFILDVLAALPYNLIDYIVNFNEDIDWYVAIWNFMHILRLRNTINYIHKFHKAYYLSFRTMKIVQIIIVLCIGVHWCACLVYYVPLLLQENGKLENTSWILSDDFERCKTRTAQYILCMNRAVTFLVSSAHFIDIKSADDIIMNFTMSILGKMFFIYLLCQVMLIFSASNKENVRLLQQLHDYMHYKELPRVTQKKLIVYCTYWLKKNCYRDKHILAQISEPLREELNLHNYTKLLETVDLLRELPRAAVESLVDHVKVQIYLAGQEIVSAGTQGEELFFIHSGTVAVYTSLGKEMCHMDDGAYFSDVCLVLDHEQRIASVKAIETCEMFIVPRERFRQIVVRYPNLMGRLQKIAIKKLDRVMVMDEIYIAEDPNPKYFNISILMGDKV
ncbi:hypothetical protein TKK_0011965 [Trichogramma kaykai]|uniref:Cyclic nucleotide-binding domain-containing protein n=1 Tax=Trichogramma kaykai TaxID=54128 RepID=A0ABD2WP06_9HYME